MARSNPARPLIDAGVEILRRYVDRPTTALLKELAPIIVDIRSTFTLDDGRTDWAGRSPQYRQAMADLYARSGIAQDALDRLQSALRYHVGNLLRERVPNDELVAVGLTTTAPKERLQSTRDALAAQREVAAPRQDVARLTAYAEALLAFVDDATIPSLEPERAVSSRLSLEEIQRRSAELLGRLSSV